MKIEVLNVLAMAEEVGRMHERGSHQLSSCGLGITLKPAMNLGSLVILEGQSIRDKMGN
jgi:hypothetical protein